jgi:hypothetical protein
MIPLFKEYEIKGMKFLDFKNFCLIAKLMKNKSHLTLNGLKKIQQIKSNMNNARRL